MRKISIKKNTYKFYLMIKIFFCPNVVKYSNPKIPETTAELFQEPTQDVFKMIVLL